MKKQLKTQQTALQDMQNANVHFSRTASNKIVVFTSSNGNGSHISEQDNIKAFLEARGFFESERGFDNICGKGTQFFTQLGMKKKA